MTDERMFSPRPWVAALLSLLGAPIGQLYAGCGARFLILASISLLLPPVVGALAVSLEGGRLAFNALLVALFCYPIYLVVDAFHVARRATAMKPRWFQRWWVYTAVLIAYLVGAESATSFTRRHVAEAFSIPTDLMSPTLKAGDRILVSKIHSEATSLEYGDVVAFRAGKPASQLYVMRVVALAGDTVQLDRDGLVRNGIKIDDAYVSADVQPSAASGRPHNAAVVVPNECFCVLADSRRRSNDNTMLGVIPNADFYGKAVRIFWSRPRSIDYSTYPAVVTVHDIAWHRIGMPIR